MSCFEEVILQSNHYGKAKYERSFRHGNIKIYHMRHPPGNFGTGKILIVLEGLWGKETHSFYESQKSGNRQQLLILIKTT